MTSPPISTENTSPKKANEEDKEKDFLGHLEELRLRILWTFGAAGAAILFSYAFLEPFVFDWLTAPLPSSYSLQFLRPQEAFLAHIKIAAATGLVLALPYALTQVWLFVRPALSARSQRGAFFFVSVSTLAFFSGILFGYYLMVPLALNFFLSYETEAVRYGGQLSSYLQMVIGLLVAAGCVFETPVAAYLLARAGLLKAEHLTRNRPYLIVGIFVLAALLTPPDVISQILLAVPFLILMEISILVVRLTRRS